MLKVSVALWFEFVSVAVPELLDEDEDGGDEDEEDEDDGDEREEVPEVFEVLPSTEVWEVVVSFWLEVDVVEVLVDDVLVVVTEEEQ